MTPRDPVKVLLVDDSPEFLRAARRHLDLEEGITVLETATDGRSAVDLAGQLRPDVVLVDMSMPRMNGIETTTLLKRLEPAPRVVLLTGHDTEVYREAAQRAGVDAMLGKWSLAEDAPALLRELCPQPSSPRDSGE